MNLIQRELRDATTDYLRAKCVLKLTNRYAALGVAAPEAKQNTMGYLNRSRARLMNVIKATNVILGRVAA